MSHPSKQKGNSFERELVNKFIENGLVALRAYASNGLALGKSAEVDVLVENTYCIQAKRRKSLPSYLQIPEGCDSVIFRQDRGPTLVLTDLDTYIEFIKQKENNE
jgi:Holliday junction resolvase